MQNSDPYQSISSVLRICDAAFASNGNDIITNSSCSGRAGLMPCGQTIVLLCIDFYAPPCSYNGSAVILSHPNKRAAGPEIAEPVPSGEWVNETWAI